MNTSKDFFFFFFLQNKVVISVPVHSQKCRSKAMQIAVGTSGVESATLKGDDKNQIEVIGDGIDAAELTRLLRKKFRYAFVESVGAAASSGDKKEEGKNEAKMEMVWPSYQSAVPLYYNQYVVRDSYYDNSSWDLRGMAMLWNGATPDVLSTLRVCFTVPCRQDSLLGFNLLFVSVLVVSLVFIWAVGVVSALVSLYPVYFWPLLCFPFLRTLTSSGWRWVQGDYNIIKIPFEGYDQKAVIKVSMHSEKCRSIAMKIAVGASGVESASLKGADKSQIEITGDGIDAAEITRLLRKKFQYAFLESVSAAAGGGDKKEGGDKKKEDKKEAKMELAWPPCYHATKKEKRDFGFGFEKERWEILVAEESDFGFSEAEKNGGGADVVIKVPVHSQKCRSKAMQIAVGASGVESATLIGDDKDQIEVTGDGIDAAELTKLLRKKFGYAILESVSADASGGDGDEPKVEVDSWPSCHATVPLYYPDAHYVVRDSNNSCSIM
ncbi:hypothetical protein EZV62_003217 [Acer yangbiense]|uniref:HMA domain-containing protein n=1 Tax=Acer yangbiense TaxID=1000413 RepID=A0A5C7IHT3_9ROSI|nr:hypothetical protein EZV62_003217 [Acer yangbiense]